MNVWVITETSPYKSDPKFPPNIIIIVKMGEIRGRNQNDKKRKISIFLHKIICCGCVLESPHGGENRLTEAILIHIQNI